MGARLEGTRLLGAVSGGQGPQVLTFTLYDASHQVQPGDRLVTFGSTDYAAGVPIGEVTKVVDVGGLSRTAEVRPFVAFATLDLVGVMLANPPTDPGDRVLEPRPLPPPPADATPAPSPGPGQGSASASPPAGGVAR
jgi:rod shape-determining protein MreC